MQKAPRDQRAHLKLLLAATDETPTKMNKFSASQKTSFNTWEL